MAFLFLRECVVVWLLVALGTTAAAGQVVSGVSESLVMNCRSDFILAGGAQEVSDPLHAVRSGSPGQQSSATPIRTIQPGAMITVAYHSRIATIPATGQRVWAPISQSAWPVGQCISRLPSRTIVTLTTGPYTAHLCR